MKGALTSPGVCSFAAVVVLLLGSTGLKANAPTESGSSPVKPAELRINPWELNDLVLRGKVLVVDVRPRAAFERAHLPGAVSVPLDEIGQRAAELRSSGKTIVTYCAGPRGDNGLKAAVTLRELGLKRVRALAGGFESWVAQGHVVETSPTLTELALMARAERVP